jgi:hypothetical protein
MPHVDLPGVKMFEVVWKRDGACVSRLYVDAASELDAIYAAEAFLAKHPNFDFNRACAAVHVRALPHA